MRPLRFVPFRLALSTLALGALVAGAGGCEGETAPPEYSTPPPGFDPGTSGGPKSDGGTTPDAGTQQVASDRPLLRLLAPAGTYAVQTRAQVFASSVHSEASGLASSGHVVTAAELGPDGVVLVGVKEFGSGRVFESSVRTGSTEAQLQEAATALAEGGYIVTAVAPSTTGFALVGMRQQGSSERVGVRVRKLATVSDVFSAALGLGSTGYGVTALVKGPAGYVLVGTQVDGGGGTYLPTLHNVPRSSLQSSVTSLAREGHVITGLAYGGEDVLIIGVKPRGATRTYSATVLQTSVAGLYSSASDLAGQGYMVTAMAFDGTEYTLVGLR